ncbi:AAA family ATPase [Rossellomorea aquimaris]|uniref:kinase n=1 Tax=Rossellomorea aquimaris TaxID=189382 RepID=UPI001CD25147|nr:kinase [Rossellomorea aquimaris]MCA1053711.1 AAA family ATPase [Rossellomorea aquimaris]
MMNDQPLLNYIRSRKDQLLVVGIDGLSRSGKTTYTQLLKKRLEGHGLDVVCLHMDDFIEPRHRRYHTGNEEWREYYFLQWDVQSLQENLFANLKSASFLRLGYYEESADIRVTKEIRLPECGVIVIEGVFLQRDEWKGYLDYVMYLDCDRESRFNREHDSAKMDTEKFMNRYWKAEDHYLLKVKPLELADHVIRT